MSASGRHELTFRRAHIHEPRNTPAINVTIFAGGDDEIKEISAIYRWREKDKAKKNLVPFFILQQRFSSCSIRLWFVFRQENR